MNRDISEAESLLEMEMSSERVSITVADAEGIEYAREEIIIRRRLSVPDLFPRHSRSDESIVSMPTVIKESVTKYHSRPISAPTSPPDMDSRSPDPYEEDPEKQQRPSQVETQGNKVTTTVQSRVANTVKDILTGRVAGKITTKILGKRGQKDERTSRTAPDSKAEAFVGKNLSSVEKATLSNPGIPNVALVEDDVGKRMTEFPRPYYSTHGRYKPHEPGDDAFNPITLAMTLPQEEGLGTSSKRPTLMIRRTLSVEKQGSKTSFTAAHLGRAGLIAESPTKGADPTVVVGPKAERTDGDNKTELSAESDSGLETEAATSSAMLLSVVSVMKYMTQSSAQARASAAMPSDAPVAEAERSTTGPEAVPEAVPEGPAPPPLDPLAPGPMTEEEMEKLRLSVRAMVGLQRWKKKANTRLSQRAGPHVTVKNYAKNARHNTVLQKNMEDLAIELPLPLQKTLYEEALPIMVDILRGQLTAFISRLIKTCGAPSVYNNKNTYTRQTLPVLL